MSWRFNPPPGWPPQPEGWQPPPGWAPDPSWPAAPPGWQFWVPAETPQAPTYPTQAPTYSPSPYQGAPAAPQAPDPYAAAQAPYPAAPASPGGYPPQPGYPGGPAQPGYPGGYPQPGYPTPQKPWYQRGGVIALGAGALVLLTALVGVGTFLALRPDEPDDPQPVAGESPSPAAPGEATPTPGDPQGEEPDPGPGPTGTGEVFEGQGSEQIPLDLDDGTLYTVTITHSGGELDWFEVYSTDGDEDVSNLAWGMGDHQGTYAINMFEDEDADGIRIDTNGSWTIELRDLFESPGWPDNSEGTGSTVLLVDPDQDDIAVTGDHDGESNFIVWAYVEDGYPSLLFNEIGAHEGTAVLPANTFAVSIIADGNWTLQQQ